jgi:cellulose synthase/poly-beta-1,6-N-acetylglucosamine synthase-like glycosyltransferase
MEASMADNAHAALQYPGRSPQQLAAEATLENDSKRRSWRVRIIIAIILAIFIACAIANLVLTFCSLFMVIPYWTVKRTSSALEIVLVVMPRIMMVLASLFCVVTFIASLLWYKEEPVLHLADFMQPVEYPSVDIFLPRYKEDWSLYEPTVRAALALDYPVDRLMVHVLDDGSRVAPVGTQLEPLMRQHPNLRYVTRPDGSHAKAGNLNNGLSQSHNALVVVFDADHRCNPDFLLRTIPHLLAVVAGHRVARLSSQTAFIQTTQVFHNEERLLVRLLDGKHSLFYKLMMPSFSGMGCTFCVGTGYVMQRAALDSVGGYVYNCAVEDVVTAVAMHKGGWKSKFLECRLTEGLSPETLNEFYTQRERWVAGSAQLLLYRCSMLTGLLPIKYRLAYLVGAWYWLVMLLFLLLILARLTMWVVFRSITGVQTTTWVPLLSEYIPVYGLFLLLPVMEMEAKFANIIALFTLFPTYFSVFWGWAAGRIRPDRHTFRVTGAAEAFGDSWPKLAYINVAFLSCITLVFCISTIPQLHVYNVPLDWMVPSVFVGWTYLVNIPVLIDLGRRIFVCCVRVTGTSKSPDKAEV